MKVCFRILALTLLCNGIGSVMASGFFIPVTPPATEVVIDQCKECNSCTANECMKKCEENKCSTDKKAEKSK